MVAGRRRIVPVVAVSAAAALLAIATWHASISAAERRQFPAPGSLVKLSDGSRRHIHCIGHGSPTVILEAGMSGWSADWSRIQPGLARLTRVCAYDRAGYGWSEESSAPRHSAATAAQLRELLRRAEVDVPYILVGHSLGGLHAQAFAVANRSETVGLVLVDSVHRRQSSAMPEAMRERYEGRLGKLTGAMAALAPTGLLRLANLPASIVATRLPVRQRAAAVGLSFQASSYRSLRDEMRAFRTSQASVGAIAGVPTTVLVAGHLRDYPPGFGAAEKRVWDGLQRRHVAGATVIRAERSGHYIQLEQPDVVLAAAVDMLARIRRSPPDACSHEPRSSSRRAHGEQPNGQPVMAESSDSCYRSTV